MVLFGSVREVLQKTGKIWPYKQRWCLQIPPLKTKLDSIMTFQVAIVIPTVPALCTVRCSGFFRAICSTSTERQQYAGLHPEEIDCIVLNCSLFNPQPGMTTMVSERFGMREDVQQYTLCGTDLSLRVDKCDRRPICTAKVHQDAYDLYTAYDSEETLHAWPVKALIKMTCGWHCYMKEHATTGCRECKAFPCSRLKRERSKGVSNQQPSFQSRSYTENGSWNSGALSIFLFRNGMLGRYLKFRSCEDIPGS